MSRNRISLMHQAMLALGVIPLSPVPYPRSNEIESSYPTLRGIPAPALPIASLVEKPKREHYEKKRPLAERKERRRKRKQRSNR